MIKLINKAYKKFKKENPLIIIDEADYIDEVDWTKLEKLMPKIKGKVFVGCDFAKGEGTAFFGHLDKKGGIVVDKITKI